MRTPPSLQCPLSQSPLCPLELEPREGGRLGHRMDCLSSLLCHPFNPSWYIKQELKEFRNFHLSIISGFHEHCLIS